MAPGIAHLAKRLRGIFETRLMRLIFTRPETAVMTPAIRRS
jgi:hypothetical protein